MAGFQGKITMDTTTIEMKRLFTSAVSAIIVKAELLFHFIDYCVEL